MAFTNWNTDAYALAGVDRSAVQDDPILHGPAQGPRLRPLRRRHVALVVRLRQDVARRVLLRRRGRRSRLLLHRGPAAEGGARAVRRPHGQAAAAAAVVARLPAVPLLATIPRRACYEIAKTFRDKKIPADVIYLDIDYQKDNRPFTIDTARFPHFEEMIADLGREGFKVIAITDLHLAQADRVTAVRRGHGRRRLRARRRRLGVRRQGVAGRERLPRLHAGRPRARGGARCTTTS